MKQSFACLILAISLRANERPIKVTNIATRISPVKNLFIITIEQAWRCEQREDFDAVSIFAK